MDRHYYKTLLISAVALALLMIYGVANSDTPNSIDGAIGPKLNPANADNWIRATTDSIPVFGDQASNDPQPGLDIAPVQSPYNFKIAHPTTLRF